MGDLKTLKDIDKHQTNQIVKYISILQKADCFRPKEKKEVIAWLTHQMKLFGLIKQEAIKVVKYYLELLKNKKPTGIDHKDQFINGSRNGAIAVMEEFFNITEEDLK